MNDRAFFKLGVRGPAVFSNSEATMQQVKEISQAGGKALLNLARRTILKQLKKGASEESDDPGLCLPELDAKRGTFVTLKIGRNLRGCIGSLTPSETIVESVRGNAIHAAFNDHRFEPLTLEEFSRIRVEVSVLTDPAPLFFNDVNDLLKKLRPGVDGVILRKGGRSATFLPQVWEDLPGKEEFLSHLCQKAGLSKNAWREPGIEIQIYQVQYFEES